MTITRQTGMVDLSGPLEGALLLHSAQVSEELGRPFEAQLELRSSDHEILMEDLLGQVMTLHVYLPGDSERCFNGHVSTCSYVGSTGDHAIYRATLRPWLWLLTLSADCRIFRGRSVPEIVTEVFRARGLTDFELRLSESYSTREYCVQYRESDFDFVSRLLEEEGIYYFFRHEAGIHTLVLCDSYGSHEPTAGYEEVRFVPPGGSGEDERQHIDEWLVSKAVRPGTYTLTDHDFERSRAALGVRESIRRDHAAADFEVFDYPGGYRETTQGSSYARVRLEALQARHELVEARTNARGLSVGGLFSLRDYPRDDQNREYLIVSAEVALSSNLLESGEARSPEPTFSARIFAMPSSEPFRTPRTTPRPVIRGPQTALVVGPEGEEIWTDEYGRAKVQFHWDRQGRADEESSCWVRVAQTWAGKKWGTLTVPRIGQEVLVDFLEGNPDRPIIVGQVYNDVCRPPYDPGQHPTITTLKSLSSKGGEGFNELRLEDEKGAEQVFVHAERNFDLRVKNDRFETVTRNRHLHVEQDKLENVEHDRDERVGNDHRESIERDRNLYVAGKEAKEVGGSLSLTVEGDAALEFRGDHTEQMRGDTYSRAQNVVIEADTNVTIKVGQSYIAIEAGGIKIGTTGRIVLDALGDLELGGFAASLKSDTQTTVEGTVGVSVSSVGMAELRGAIVKIN